MPLRPIELCPPDPPFPLLQGVPYPILGMPSVQQRICHSSFQMLLQKGFTKSPSLVQLCATRPHGSPGSVPSRPLTL